MHFHQESELGSRKQFLNIQKTRVKKKKTPINHINSVRVPEVFQGPQRHNLYNPEASHLQ